MTSADRSEFQSILRDQSSIHGLVASLDRRIAALGRSLASSSAPEPPPLPTVVAAPAAVAPAKASVPFAASAQSPEPAAAAAPPAKEPATKSAPRAQAPAESIELKFGTYWLARMGIVILLTGFVFLGNYAYHHIVPHLGAWGKLSLLALGGAALSGAGSWLERGRDSMRSYARVLLAGGAATFYYTAYAAHFVAPLRVIESPLLGGALLLVIAGGFLWLAERRRSEPLALSAVLLSYYTAAINPIGSFSLFSNLLLTAVAVVFLIRHRWVAISFASLAATYASFGFWRFHALAATGESGSGEFGMALAFLAAYWLLFTAAVFLSRRDTLPTVRRIAFLTANNGALFACAAQHFAAHRPDSFWMFALGFGAVLLALAAIAARRRPDEPALDGAYLAQGLALLAIGCAAKLSGPQLAAVFAVESAVLLTLSRARHRWLYEIAAGLAALAAFDRAFDAILKNPALTLSLGGAVALVHIFDAWWIKRLRCELAAGEFSGRALGFALLGLLLAGEVIWKSTPEIWRPAALGAAALVCAVSAGAVRVPEIALPGQAFLIAAAGTFAVRSFDLAPEPAWSPLPLLAVAFALTHWWQHQRALALDGDAAAALQLACAAAATASGVCWLHAMCHGDAWLVATSAAAFATLIYGAATRAWAAALVGQLFTVLSVQAFLAGTILHGAGLGALLAPIANLALTARLVSVVAGRFPALPAGTNLAHFALVYRGAVLAGVWLWVTRYAGSHDSASGLTVAWALLALVVFVAGLVLRERIYRVGGLVILALAIGRILIVDVWQLETLYRILSFLVLGAVLLLLGYLYNRFADSIRRWL